MKKYLLTLLVVIVLGVFITIFIQMGSPGSGNKMQAMTETPSDIVQSFAKKAAINGKEGVKDLIRPYPSQYIECLYETKEECAIKRANKQKTESAIKTPNVADGNSLGDPVTNLIVLKFAEGFADKRFNFGRIRSEWIKGNEARVRIVFNLQPKESEEEMDFLLLKENEKWKIFELVEKDERINFAFPD